MKFNTLITGKLPQHIIEIFQKDPLLQVEYHPDLDYSHVMERLTGVHVLVSRSETKVDLNLLEQAKDLKLIARAAVGVGNIDLAEATKRGILVVNCPGLNTNSAAELTMGLILGSLRKLPQAHVSMKNGLWDRHKFTGRELRRKTLGIVGLGHVGHRVAKFALGFDMKVLAYDPYIGSKVFAEHGAIQCKDLPSMLGEADIVTVHVPQNRETTGMIGKREIALMKPGSVVINAARGGIIEEQALSEALESGHLAAAGIDTWDHEPHPDSQLLGFPSLFATPHIGASTIEAQNAIGQAIYDQVAKFVRQTVVDYPVNLPGVGVPDHPLLGAYAALCEKIGSILGQTLDFNPEAMNVCFSGELIALDTTLLRLALQKGYLTHVVDAYVSYVNATELFAGRGINYLESKEESTADYKSCITIEVKGLNGACAVIAGTVFEQQHGRIIRINSHDIELVPSGHFVLIENEDRPGVVGKIGSFMGEHNINIDSFQLSRDRQGGMAMALVKVDSVIPEALLAKLVDLPHIKNARLLHL